jgi:ABC-type multidrug transport system fused ATPase/permease subunit
MVYSIDGLDISSIGLFDLRGRLAIIPQDPAMFEGTLRDNLDPRHAHDDTELWSVLGMLEKTSMLCLLRKLCLQFFNLDHAKLKDHVTSMEGQLDAQIQEAGKNCSVQ